MAATRAPPLNRNLAVLGTVNLTTLVCFMLRLWDFYIGTVRRRPMLIDQSEVSQVVALLRVSFHQLTYRIKI